MKQIAVGYSGGIDSTAVIIDFARQSYAVDAVFLMLNDNDRTPSLPAPLRDMGVHLSVLDMRQAFRENVKGYFARLYAGGLTPNPCAMCNRFIKFRMMSRYAADSGYEGFSTGHYICVNNCMIKRSADREKDQSYFVSTVEKKDLYNFINSRNCISTKHENRQLLRDMHIISEKRESQDICFVRGDYADYLENEMGLKPQSGIFTDTDGNKLGKYSSHYRYTVGQREGLNGGMDRRLYVKSINTEKREIVLSDEEHMQFGQFNAHVISRFDSIGPNLTVKTRYRQEQMHIDRVEAKGDDILCILKKSCRDITPGQIAVFYRDNTVIMSAEIIDAQ